MPNAWPAMEQGRSSFSGQVHQRLSCSGETNHRSGGSTFPNLGYQSLYTPADSSVEEG